MLWKYQTTVQRQFLPGLSLRQKICSGGREYRVGKEKGKHWHGQKATTACMVLWAEVYGSPAEVGLGQKGKCTSHGQWGKSQF